MKNLLAALSFTLVCACGLPPDDESAPAASREALIKGGGFTEGGACHVIDGPNKGKTGTYDEDGSCCDEADWGCTDCDTGKCEDGPAPKRSVSIGGGSLTETPGTLAP